MMEPNISTFIYIFDVNLCFIQNCIFHPNIFTKKMQLASSSNFMNNFFLRAGTHFFFWVLRHSIEPKKLPCFLVGNVTRITILTIKLPCVINTIFLRTPYLMKSQNDLWIMIKKLLLVLHQVVGGSYYFLGE